MTTLPAAEAGFETNFDDGFDAFAESEQIAIVLQAVQAVGANTAFLRRQYAGHSAEIRPKALLMVLVYSYTRGVYGSEEIERLVPQILPLQFLSGGPWPSAEELIGFRRHAFTQLREALEHVLVRTGIASPADASTEADRRLARAVFFDSMDRDW